MKPIALSIAGSDPSGGAGIQADLKTFQALGVYGMSVITLITVQNTLGIKKISILSPELVQAQLQAVMEDIKPHAIKTGALGNAAIMDVIAHAARRFRSPLIIDPVMISKHGARLMDRTAVSALRLKLLPKALLVTPNIPEAEILSGLKIRDLISMEKAAQKIAQSGVKAVLIKGGHLKTAAYDLLFEEGKTTVWKASRIHTAHTHGTGCTFSAAITAELAKGKKLSSAFRTAKAYVTAAIKTSPQIGHGQGPVNHQTRPSRASIFPVKGR